MCSREKVWRCACKCVRARESERQCEGLTAILTEHWIFLTFILLSTRSSLFSINTLPTHLAPIRTFSPVNRSLQSRFGALLCATYFAQGPSPFTFSKQKPSLRQQSFFPFKCPGLFRGKRKYPAPNLLFKFAFSVELCVHVCVPWSSPTCQAWSWTCRPCQSGRASHLSPTFDWPLRRKHRVSVQLI